jgi:hypothetical protein
MSKRVRLDPKIKSKSKSVTSAPVPRVRVFGQPQVLEGEDGKLSTNARLWAGRAPYTSAKTVTSGQGSTRQLPGS